MRKDLEKKYRALEMELSQVKFQFTEYKLEHEQYERRRQYKERTFRILTEAGPADVKGNQINKYTESGHLIVDIWDDGRTHVFRNPIAVIETTTWPEES